MPDREPNEGRHLGRHDDGLGLRAFGELAERLDVFLGDEVVDRVDVALGDRLGHRLGGAGLGLGQPLAGLGVAEGGLLAALGLQHGGLLGPLGAGDRRLLFALGLGDHRAPLALGLHLAGHGVGDVGRRHQVLDLDPRRLDAPGLGRQVDGLQQAGVDRLALRQHIVQVHRADHGAQVGLGQLADGVGQVVDPVGGVGRVDHLDEDDGVDLDGDIVLGDHLLLRHRQHLFHHVHPPPDALVERGQQGHAGLEGAGVAAEPLDGELSALGHDLDRGEQEGQGEHDQGERRIGHGMVPPEALVGPALQHPSARDRPPPHLPSSWPPGPRRAPPRWRLHAPCGVHSGERRPGRRGSRC